MVKPLSFKGEKKPKKRKLNDLTDEARQEQALEKLQTASAAQEDDSWVSAEVPSDVIGPIVLVLPSDPPTCLACDANGSVFTNGLENVVDGDPATAEPHDVRQVWVVSRIAGTENISFKGHHTKYLSCDNIGLLSARTEAISPDETFTCFASPDTPGTFSIQTVRDKFLSVAETSKGAEARGDAETISFTTTVRIRMQARFKPRLKASKDSKAKEKISRKELEEAAGRRLEDHEVKRLKRARVDGSYHEAILDVRVKGKHDKYS